MLREVKCNQCNPEECDNAAEVTAAKHINCKIFAL